MNDSAEAIYRMIQVFSHMQDGLQPNLVARYRFHTKRLRQIPFIYSLISAFLRLFFHVQVLSHPKAHLHFALLANARKRLR